MKKIDGSGTTVFVYNAGGQLIAEYHSDPVPPPAGGGGTSYLTTDHLGSTRVVTKADGTVKARYDYLPFGEELGATIGQRTTGMGYSLADSTKQKFTQKERDIESGLDYFGERYYSSAQGRFTTCDPLGMTIRPSDPQTMNRFVFVLNNPLRYVDPDGLAETTPWERLNDEERRILASKLTTVGNAKKPTQAELKAAGGAFNQLINRPEQIGGRGIAVAASAKQVSERIAAVQNFIDLAGGHGGHGGEGSAVWQQIQGINNVWESGMVEVVVKDRGQFTQALKSEGYAVSAFWDIGPHDNDSARQLSDTSLEPGLHFANDRSDRITTYWAHVDQRSANFNRTTYASRPREMIDAALSHNRPSIPSQIRQFLKIKGISPSSER
ncbi:MAG: RHS repeat-associated core domain-containing protein [Blastocatellia bacterium]